MLANNICAYAGTSLMDMVLANSIWDSSNYITEVQAYHKDA